MKDKKILVVDFDEESLISLSNLVFEEGFQAVTAMDGLSGYEKFRAEDFDLVMIEPMLPKLHGFELMKRINQDPVKKVPIIVVTGIYREPSCKMEALQVYGASAYFTKPWDKDEVRSKMLSLLVNGMKEEVSQPEPPVKKQESPPPTASKSSSSPIVDEWGLLKPQPVPHGPKAGRDIDDIEKELRAAVAGLAGPVRKKEPVKDVFKEKKEAKAGADGDIEALLKGAIGGLGLEETKKKPEPAVHHPTAVPKPEPKPEKKEKIPIAKEIKERIPLQDNTGSIMPHPSVRGPIHTEKEPFGIDQTLIEIDKIPLETEKHVPEPIRTSHERVVPLKKSVYFDEYSAPAAKKPPLTLIGGITIGLLIVAGSALMVVKFRKPKEQSPQMVSSVQPSLPSEFALRQDEIRAPAASRQNEAKPESKRTQAKTTEQTDPSEIVDQIKPVLPDVSLPMGLEIQTPPESEAEEKISEKPAALQTEDLTSNELPAPPSPRQKESPAFKLPPEKPKPGDLFSLEEVTVQPAVVRMIDPKYPAQALRMRVSGTVTVNALISETGDVIRTEILKGIKGDFGFEKAAEAAVRDWKFSPAEKDGVPVRVWKAININFKMNQTANQ
jgi:TonB family protein